MLSVRLLVVTKYLVKIEKDSNKDWNLCYVIVVNIIWYNKC